MSRSTNDEAKQLILRQAIDESLRALGDSIYETLTWHLRSGGFSLDSKNFDMVTFHKHMYQLFGSGADMVMDMIWERLRRQSNIMIDSNIAHSDSYSSLEKIQIAMKNGAT